MSAAPRDAGGCARPPAGAAVSAWAVETDEERMIALHTVAALGLA